MIPSEFLFGPLVGAPDAIAGSVVLLGFCAWRALVAVVDYRDQRELNAMAQVQAQAALYRYADQLRRQVRA